MKNTFNYTGRKKIKRKDIKIALERQESEARVEKIDLSGLGIDENAEIMIEIETGKTGLKRESLGAVGKLDLPVAFPIDDFDFSDVSFRIKVIDSKGDSPNALILADADNLKPDSGDFADSLLEVKPSEDLGQRIWKIEFTAGRPELLINSSLDDWQGVGKSDLFQSLIFPQVVFEIARWLRSFQTWEDDAPEGLWRKLFKSIGYDPDKEPQRKDFNGNDNADEEYADDVDSWADDIASSFATSNKALAKFPENQGKTL